LARERVVDLARARAVRERARGDADELDAGERNPERDQERCAQHGDPSGAAHH
jgi:hypothetical protein